jgi:type I restriction enzyme S subunit
MRLRIRDSDADKDFLIYWLRANQTRRFVKSRASGASSTMKKIKQEDVCSIPFPTIDFEEQRRWAGHLDAVQTEVNSMQSVLDEEERLLDELERSILERAFRGEL